MTDKKGRRGRAHTRDAAQGQGCGWRNGAEDTLWHSRHVGWLFLKISVLLHFTGVLHDTLLLITEREFKPIIGVIYLDIGSYSDQESRKRENRRVSVWLFSPILQAQIKVMPLATKPQSLNMVSLNPRVSSDKSNFPANYNHTSNHLGTAKTSDKCTVFQELCQALNI